MLVRHGRECKNCSASGSPTKEQRDQCPLRPHLSRKPTKDLEEDQPDGILDAEEIESPIKKARKPKKEEHAEVDMHGL